MYVYFLKLFDYEYNKQKINILAKTEKSNSNKTSKTQLISTCSLHRYEAGHTEPFLYS